MKQKLKVDCPQCGKKTQWSTDNAFRPFCSERCKMIDLGAWASESYQIPTEPEIDDYSSSFEDPESGMLGGSKSIH